MAHLIDRADGKLIGDIDGEQINFLRQHLEEEYEGDTDFFLSDAVVEMLEAKGLAAEVVAMLRPSIEARSFIEIGIEEPAEEHEVVLAGKLVDAGGEPLGGLRLDLCDVEEEEGLGWCFSRPDGSFKLVCSPGSEREYELLVSARGALLLKALELSSIEPGEQEMEPLVIRTGTGSVKTEGGEGLPLCRVEIVGSWTLANEQGEFVLPVDETEEGVVDLEVFACTGEPLGGYTEGKLSASNRCEFGQLLVPEPNPSWPPEPHPLLASIEQ